MPALWIHGLKEIVVIWVRGRNLLLLLLVPGSEGIGAGMVPAWTLLVSSSGRKV